jgi:hypothetical protein
LTDEKLRALSGNDLAVFSDLERLVIELADALADTPSSVSEDLYSRCVINFLKNSCWSWERRSRLRTIGHA